MDLHVYRNSQDRWHDLKAAARERGAVLALNAVTLDELVQRVTPDVKTATPGQRMVVIQQWELATRGTKGTKERNPSAPLVPLVVNSHRYFNDAIGELKAARVRPGELRAAAAELLADVLEHYDHELRKAGLSDPQDRRVLAASRVNEGSVSWLQRFERVVLHALYDLTEAEFMLVRSLIEALPEGGAVILFNTTANVKPTQFAEWTWQRFIRDESLAEKTFPEFCRPLHPTRAVLEKLFLFEPHDPLPPDHSLRIVEAPGRYKEVEQIGSNIANLLALGEGLNEIAVVVRHIESYGEMLEDVFTRYGISHTFETGMPLLRIPFIKYWLSLLDLVTSERSRESLARVMSSAYFNPRLTPGTDVERALAGFGYIDRRHLSASALSARKHSPLTSELEGFEKWLDKLEAANDSVSGFLAALQPSRPPGERDGEAWRALAEELEAVHIVAGEKIAFAEFRQIASEIAGLRTVDRSTGAASAPGLTRIRIMSPRSLGYREYKWIFAPGFADGEFPARSSSNPLLPDATIEAINVQIRPRRLMTARDRNRREPLYLFMILDSAERQVTLTYPGSTLEGEQIYPSVYVGEIARHYAESPVVRSVTGVARADGEWRSRVAGEWRRGTLTEERVRELIGDDIVDRAKLEAKGAARAHIGGGVLSMDHVWHPSELNSLSSCPFVFLARHRLKLRAPETPDFEVPAMEIGILAHSILRDFYMEPVSSSTEESRARMDRIIARRLAAADVSGEGTYSVFDPSLWKIRRRQLVSVLNQYVSFAVRDAQDGFETQLEYLDSALPQAQMGGTRLAGKPDHVAVHRDGSTIDAIRIDDFKYSAASSSTARQLKQSFQIPVYAYLAARALRADPGVRIDGRYLLLRSPGNPVVSQAIDETVFADVQVRIEELLTKVRDGRLSPDPADRQGCSDCEYRRLCRLYGG